MSVIFTGLWAFIAAVILILVVCDGIADIVRAWRGKDDK